MSHRTHSKIIIVSLAYLLGQLIAGTNGTIALLLTSAIACGLYSVPIAGGILSAAGLLNAILVAYFLLIAVALKILMLEPAEKNLLAPETTATVMALGFFGLLVGTFIHRRLPTPRLSPISGVSTPRMYLALTLVFLVFGYVGYFVGIGPDLAGGTRQTGGILGFARAFSSFKSFVIVPALYYAWMRGGKRFMTHPLPLGIIVFGTLLGIITTSKQDAMEPFAFYIVVSAFRYGFLDKRLWCLTAIGTMYYALVIYPYSMYVRNNGGRQGDFASRVVVMRDVFWRTLTDPKFREHTLTKTTYERPSYLGRDSLEAFSRLAMIGEADRLIAATEQQHAFTGWETITWGFKLMVPSFIYPDKPIWTTGNFLGHIAGDAGPEDTTTQWAYGIMANLYNAFAYPGVFIGCMIFFAGFYYVFRCWFRNPRYNSSPTGTTLWFMLIIAFFQHSIVEEPLAGLIADMTMPVLVTVIYYVAKLLCLFLASDRSIRQIRRVRPAIAPRLAS